MVRDERSQQRQGVEARGRVSPWSEARDRRIAGGLASLVVPNEAVLVVAPHPDDEVIGCGGAIAAHAAAGLRVSVAYLTESNEVRRREAQKALACLGSVPTVTLNLIEGQVRAETPTIAALLALIEREPSSAIMVPNLLDRHPDHRGANRALAVALSQRARAVRRIYAYEGFRPLTAPDVLLDISRFAPSKWEAMAQFVSQDRLYRIRDTVIHLNAYRARTTMRRHVEFVEAFESMTPAEYIDRIRALR